MSNNAQLARIAGAPTNPIIRQSENGKSRINLLNIQPFNV